MNLLGKVLFISACMCRMDFCEITDYASHKIKNRVERRQYKK